MSHIITNAQAKVQYPIFNAALPIGTKRTQLAGVLYSSETRDAVIMKGPQRYTGGSLGKYHPIIVVEAHRSRTMSQEGFESIRSYAEPANIEQLIDEILDVANSRAVANRSSGIIRR